MTRVAGKPRWAKVRNPAEWICDKCRFCGDVECCKEKSKEVIHRIVGKNVSLCSDCYKLRNKRGAKPKETGFHILDHELSEVMELEAERHGC